MCRFFRKELNKLWGNYGISLLKKADLNIFLNRVIYRCQEIQKFTVMVFVFKGSVMVGMIVQVTMIDCILMTRKMMNILARSAVEQQ